MAGNLPTPNGVELKLVFSKAGVPFALNIIHFTHTLGQVHNQTRADSIDSIYKAAMTSSGFGATLGTTITLARVDSRHMDSNEDAWFRGGTPPVAGTGTGDLLPPQVAFVVSLVTGKRGRSFNGRVYLTGFVEAVCDPAGQITATARDACVNFLGTAAGQMVTQLQLTAGLLSRWTTPPGSPPNTPPTERNPPIITPLTNHLALDSRFDTQRRRAIPGI